MIHILLTAFKEILQVINKKHAFLRPSLPFKGKRGWGGRWGEGGSKERGYMYSYG